MDLAYILLKLWYLSENLYEQDNFQIPISEQLIKVIITVTT